MRSGRWAVVGVGGEAGPRAAILDSLGPRKALQPPLEDQRRAVVPVPRTAVLKTRALTLTGGLLVCHGGAGAGTTQLQSAPSSSSSQLPAPLPLP
jgi:hypothetical protein